MMRKLIKCRALETYKHDTNALKTYKNIMHTGRHVYLPKYNMMQRPSASVSQVRLVCLLSLHTTWHSSHVWFINGVCVLDHVWHIWATSGRLRLAYLRGLIP